MMVDMFPSHVQTFNHGEFPSRTGLGVRSKTDHEKSKDTTSTKREVPSTCLPLPSGPRTKALPMYIEPQKGMHTTHFYFGVTHHEQVTVFVSAERDTRFRQPMLHGTEGREDGGGGKVNVGRPTRSEADSLRKETDSARLHIEKRTPEGTRVGSVVASRADLLPLHASARGGEGDEKLRKGESGPQSAPPPSNPSHTCAEGGPSMTTATRRGSVGDEG